METPFLLLVQMSPYNNFIKNYYFLYPWGGESPFLHPLVAASQTLILWWSCFLGAVWSSYGLLLDSSPSRKPQFMPTRDSLAVLRPCSKLTIASLPFCEGEGALDAFSCITVFFHLLGFPFLLSSKGIFSLFSLGGPPMCLPLDIFLL